MRLMRTGPKSMRASSAMCKPLKRKGASPCWNGVCTGARQLYVPAMASMRDEAALGWEGSEQ